MVNSYFLLLLLVIVFANLYFDYKKHSQEYFFGNNKKKRRKKRKQKQQAEKERKLQQLNELIQNTNSYYNDNIIINKLRNLEPSQLQGYLDFLNSQDAKYKSLLEYNSVKEKISNNQTYIQNLVSNLIGEQVDWKFS